MIHTIEVDKKNYNLVKLEWRKTNFTFNNKPIGLTLHLLHNDYYMNRLNIIIPLDFVNDKIEEGFKNIYYNKMENLFKAFNPEIDISTNNFSKKKFFNLDKKFTKLNNSFSDIGLINDIEIKNKNKFNLFFKYLRKYNINDINTNQLLKEDQIPIYQCCDKTIGPIIKINLCQLKTIIENNIYFRVKIYN